MRVSKKLKRSPEEILFAVLGTLTLAERDGDDLNELFQDLVGEGKFSTHIRSDASVDELRSSILAAVEEISQRPESVSARRRRSRPVDIQTIRARQARRLERARRGLIEEFGTQAELSRDLERLKEERKILVLPYRDMTYVPSFQFDEEGRPRSSVAEVIRILGRDTSDWGLALWFTGRYASLGNRRPVDLLAAEPHRVVEAAEREAAPLYF